jgi:hypothetical protein
LTFSRQRVYWWNMIILMMEAGSASETSVYTRLQSATTQKTAVYILTVRTKQSNGGSEGMWPN